MQKSSIKMVFFGSFSFAVPVLEALVSAGYEIVTVITNPDKPSGRNKILTPPPVKLKAESLNLKVLQPEKLRDNSGLVEELKKLNPDVGIVIGYGKIIPPEIFNLPEHGTLVIHPSLLPKYRGPSPVQTAILNNDLDTGTTIMKIDEEMDHGDIIAASPYRLSPNASYEEAHSALFNLGAELLIKILPDYLDGKITPQPQDHPNATQTHKFTAEDGEIKSTDTAKQAYDKIRALNPEPGTYVWFSAKGGSRPKADQPLAGAKISGGKKIRLKILGAELKDGRLEFTMVQPEGGKAMSFKEFLAGHPNFNLKNNLLQ